MTRAANLRRGATFVAHTCDQGGDITDRTRRSDIMSLDHHHAAAGACRPRRPALVAIAMALTLGGLACASDSDDLQQADTESIDQTSAAGGSTDTTADDSGTSDDGDTETTDDEAAGGAADEVLGTARTQLPTEPGSTTPVPLRADVAQLERHGDLVELTIALTNESPPSAGSEATFEPWNTFREGGTLDVSGIGLVDPQGQKLYLPALDSEGVCLCTNDHLSSTGVEPGGTMILVATIGGVPDDLEQVDVHVPGFPAVVGVTIQ